MRDGISRSAQAQRTTATLRRATHTALRAALAHGMAWHGPWWPAGDRLRSPQRSAAPKEPIARGLSARLQHGSQGRGLAMVVGRR